MEYELYLYVNVSINNLLDGTLVVAGASLPHGGHVGRQVLHKDELGSARDGVSSVIDAHHLESSPDYVGSRQVGNKLRHTTGAFGLEL